MKKTLVIGILLCLSTLTLSANNGTKVYETKCKMCHMTKPMMDMKKMMSMSQEEKISMKSKMMKMMKAPPMNKVSAKLKFDLKNDKTAFVAFVKDYIVNPSKDKSHCMPMALKRFGTMPPIGKAMSKEDIDVVANWLYNNFSDTWDMNDKGMSCNAKKDNNTSKMMTSSKCGMAHKKENAGKCGGAEETTKKEMKMKCASGKCGGK